MALNFGLLDTSIPERLGAMPANALAMRRQRLMQDEQIAGQREQQQMQNALAQMQMEKAQGDMQREEAFRNSFAGVTDGNYEAALPQMYQADPTRAMAFQKQLGEQKKGQVETTLKRFEIIDRAAGQFAANPTRQTAYQSLQMLEANGTPPELIAQMKQLIDATPDEQLPKIAQQFLGQTKEGIKAQTARLFPSMGEFEKTTQLAGLSPEQTEAAARQKLVKETTHAPGTSVSVNTGQKGFENELKIRSDFRSEPVYKAHQEMSSAYSQIQQALKQASPAGDLAGATKIMKLLDPGSVVRESELGMAMAASGLLDRVSNYATNIINGTKLTPTQRADFQKLADALYSESVKAYNAKGNEYRSIATDYGMNPERIVGAPASAPASGKAAKSQYVETRRTPDGRVLGKRADGSVEVIQ